MRDLDADRAPDPTPNNRYSTQFYDGPSDKTARAPTKVPEKVPEKVISGPSAPHKQAVRRLTAKSWRSSVICRGTAQRLNPRACVNLSKGHLIGRYCHLYAMRELASSIQRHAQHVSLNCGCANRPLQCFGYFGNARLFSCKRF